MRIIIIILSLFLSSIVFANDGSYTYSMGSGGAVMPVQNDMISMKKEKITINVFFETMYSYRVEYDCQFVFRNATGEQQTVLMGFPNSKMYDFSGYASKIEQSGNSFSNFKFIVNGKEVSYKIVTNAYNPGKKNVPVYDEVYVAEVNFLPDETKEVRNTYVMGKHITSAFHPMGGTAPVSNNSIDYIVLTGNTWKEPIGEADISVILNNFPDDFLSLSGSPIGYIESKDRIDYHFTDFVPKEDIHLKLGFKYIEIPKAIEQINSYFKQGRLDMVSMLFDKFREVKRQNNLTRKDKDLLRTTAFFIAGKVYKTNIQLAQKLYLHSLEYCYSVDRYYYNFLEDDTFEFFKHNFKEWEHEGENNAPCYYIAYNLACINSKNNNTKEAKKWLQAAFEIEPSLLSIAQSDTDLDNLRNANGGVIENKRQKEKKIAPSIIEKGGYLFDIKHIGTDKDNNLFIIYRDSNNKIKYAVMKNNKWSISIINNGEEFSEHLSVVVDKQNNICVTYADQKKNILNYARLKNNTWITEIIDSGGPFYQPYTVIDNGNTPNVFYYSLVGKNIKYAKKTITGWNIEKLNDKDGIGGLAGATIDRDNQIRVFYPCETGNLGTFLKCAIKSTFGWNIQIIDNGINISNTLSSFRCAIALQQNKIPYIVYHHYSEGRSLRYATSGTDNKWVVHEIINNKELLSNDCIAFDKAGNFLIGFADYTNNMIVIKENRQGTLKTHVFDVDAAIPWGGIFIDKDDRIHIVYNNTLTHDLQYVEWKPGF